MSKAICEIERSSDDIDEAILHELHCGKRARAILFYIRKYGGTPRDAWHAIDGLCDTSPFDAPDQDPHVGTVERYLAGRHSFKHNLACTLITLGVIAISALIVFRSWSEFAKGIDSYSWETTNATVVNARYYGNRRYSQGREVDNHFVDYQFRYPANGCTYSHSISRQPFVELFDGPKWRSNDTIAVVVDPDDPSRAIHIRRMYHRTLPVLLGVVIMLPAIGLLLLATCFEISYRDLQRCDPALRNCHTFLFRHR